MLDPVAVHSDVPIRDVALAGLRACALREDHSVAVWTADTAQIGALVGAAAWPTEVHVDQVVELLP